MPVRDTVICYAVSIYRQQKNWLIEAKKGQLMKIISHTLGPQAFSLLDRILGTVIISIDAGADMLTKNRYNRDVAALEHDRKQKT
jgi:hypothetical protein